MSTEKKPKTIHDRLAAIEATIHEQRKELRAIFDELQADSTEAGVGVRSCVVDAIGDVDSALHKTQFGRIRAGALPTSEAA